MQLLGRRLTERVCPSGELTMAKVILGNHTAVFAARSEQDKIRKVYCEVLGCKARVKTDEVELDDVHFCFVYQSTALAESDFLKAIYLELKTGNPEEMRHKILTFGAKKLDVPDPHLYFQAPGGQYLSSWVSTKTFLFMRNRLHQDVDRLRRH
jgi:hypothetical protein